jgi:hypothetical protein
VKDSLGGILTKGLLGNPIIAYFNLFLEIIVEPVPTPTPSISATPSVTPYPTPTPLPGGGSGGGSTGGRGGIIFDTFKTPREKNIRIIIRYKGKSVTTYHNNEDKFVHIVINILRVFNSVKDRIKKVTLRKIEDKDTTINKIKVKKHDS